MNTVEIINSFSDESILALVAFLGAGAFYMLRLTKIMRARITEFEERDLDGRDAFKNDVDTLHQIEERIRNRYQNARDHVEQELVEYELASFALNPQLKLINAKIQNSAQNEELKISNLGQKLQDLSKLMTSSESKGSSLEPVRSALPQAIQIASQMQQTIAHQNSKINQMNGDIRLIKKGHGVE